jgi:hypothetical protein
VSRNFYLASTPRYRDTGALSRTDPRNVDHGPVVTLQARLGELLFGDSLFAIRILSALAGAATVFLTMAVAY